MVEVQAPFWYYEGVKVEGEARPIQLREVYKGLLDIEDGDYVLVESAYTAEELAKDLRWKLEAVEKFLKEQS